MLLFSPHLAACLLSTGHIYNMHLVSIRPDTKSLDQTDLLFFAEYHFASKPDPVGIFKIIEQEIIVGVIFVKNDSKWCSIWLDHHGLDPLIFKDLMIVFCPHRPNTAETTHLVCQLLHNMCYTPEFNSRRLWWLSLTRLSRQCLLHAPLLVCVRLLLVTFR